MEPIPFQGELDDIRQRLTDVIEAYPRTQIVTSSGPYLHVEFRSLIFRFVDDVEFLIDPQERVIHFRSASRVGYSDLGANRRRLRQLQQALNANGE